MDKKLISELIETAVIKLDGLGLTEETMKSYECRAFHPIKNFFLEKNVSF